MGVNTKQRVFVEEYLQCFNATEAARRAGYAYPNNNAKRLMLNDGIQKLIEARISEKAMSADEVLTRLADIARGDIGDFMDISRMSFSISLEEAKERGLTHLIKKVRQRTKIDMKTEEETHDLEIELQDRLAALVQLGRHHGLFTDKTEVTGAEGSALIIKVIYDDYPNQDAETAPGPG